MTEDRTASNPPAYPDRISSLSTCKPAPEVPTAPPTTLNHCTCGDIYPSLLEHVERNIGPIGDVELGVEGDRKPRLGSRGRVEGEG